ncbi:hypothetical protein L1987_54499 [Smallanthus sonchifolius]|uniref:Uncharacterized protein n=1 Tax=Smallanthus sonchifolius TaxID=185202 RepID=A0ACB9E7D6_9ASTR|nr:hypothetical protein L1987_54499 [Smallanthus sonchifolius]
MGKYISLPVDCSIVLVALTNKQTPHFTLSLSLYIYHDQPCLHTLTPGLIIPKNQGSNSSASVTQDLHQ